MAKSLDELIEYLLSEIAICGSAGVSISQLTEFVKAFYNNDRQPSKAQAPTTTSSSTVADADQTVNDELIAKVWQWLGKHRNVSIGRHGEFNDIPLQRFQTDEVNSTQRPHIPRVYASQELIYRSICGHSPNKAQIFPKEYALLCQIAAARANGILQGDLGRLTDQDKRSVPKRTDSLQAKGYIIKQPVTVRGTKTSRLILRQYANNLRTARPDVNIDTSAAVASPPNGQRLRVRDVVQEISDSLADGSLVELEKLLVILGNEDEAARKVLSRILRPLEKAGCFKRVKTAFGPAAHSGDLKTCVQQLRAPSEEDLTSFAKASIPLDRPIREWLVEEKARVAPLHASTDLKEPQSAKSLMWNPDRLITNVLQQAISESGSAGLKGATVREATPGPFEQGALSSVLGGRPHRDLLSRPNDLRHLAVVRSTQTSGGGSGHVYHSFHNFLKGVEDGSIDASTVPGVKDWLPISQPSSVELAIVHERGIANDPPFLPDYDFVDERQNEHATLGQLIESAAADDLHPGAGEPRIVVNDDGIKVIERLASEGLVADVGDAEVRRVRPQPRRKPRRRLLRNNSDDKPRGRPRRFLRGTEKFWQYHFWQAKLAVVGEENAPSTREGVMHDPAGLEVFECRPAAFDETVIDAKAAGFPLPAAPDEITEEWVRETRDVLERSGNGAYITPSGMYLGRVKYRSQLLIVRSNRLNSVDWYDRTKVPEFRFISSSVAHSFQCQTYYPQMVKPPRRLPRTPRKSKPLARPTSKQKDKTARAPEEGSKPQLGVFHEAATVGQDESVDTWDLGLPPAQLPGYHQYMDTTESDTDVGIAHTPLRSIPRIEANDGHFQEVGKDQHSVKLLRPASENATLEQQSLGSLPFVFPRSTPPVKNTVVPVVHIGTTAFDLPAAAWDEEDNTSRHLQRHKSHTVAKQVRLSASLEEAPERRASSPITVNDGPSDDALTESVPVDGPAFEGKSGDLEKTDAVGIEGQTHVQLGDEQDHQYRPRTQSPSTDSDAIEPESPIRRQRRMDGSGALCQRIILVLVSLADGSAPNNRTTLQRHMANRWQASGGKDRPLMKPIKAAVNNLTNSGKLKEHIFTFRGKGGVVIRRSILHLPNIDPTSTQISELKKTIVDADATEYVPQEWLAEALPLPNSTRVRKRSMLVTERSPAPGDSLHPHDIIATSEALPSVPAASSTRPKRTPKRRKILDEALSSIRETTASPEPEASSATGSLTLKLPSSSPSPEPPRVTCFLTLKVPGLRTLQQVRDFDSSSHGPSWKTLLPAVPLQFNPNASASGSTALPTPKAQRKSGLRKRHTKNTQYDDTTRKIIWAPLEEVLPQDLEHLLRLEAIKGNGLSEIVEADPKSTFFGQIDIVAEWEKRDAASILSKDVRWTFINHESSVIFPATSAVRTWYNVGFDDALKEVQCEDAESVSWDSFQATQQKKSVHKNKLVGGRRVTQSLIVSLNVRKRQAVGSTVALQGSHAFLDPERRVTRQATGTVKKRRWTSLGEEPEASPQAKRARRSGVNAGEDFREEPVPRPEPVSKDQTPKAARRPQKTATRAIPGKPRPLLEGKDLHLAIAVVCVRTLAGGIEKAIDWTCVLKLFPEKEEVLKNWWKTVSQWYEYEINKLSKDFHDKYLDAFEQGAVPSVDFDDISGTKWQETVAWAQSHLDTTSLHVGKHRLGASRMLMFEDNDIQVEEFTGLKEFYGHSAFMSNQAKQEIHSTIIGGQRASLLICRDPVQHASGCELDLRDPVFAAARSCVLASILTPDTTFDKQMTEEKLGCLADTPEESQAMIKKALTALQRDKLISRRLAEMAESASLRQWQLTDTFDEILVSCRLVHHMMVRTAASYKLNILDAAFSLGESVIVAKDAIMDDGVMLAVLNLLSQGQIRMRHGADVPSSRYGIDWQNVGYQTKLIDKNKIAFSVKLQPTDAYKFGDPIASVRVMTVPRGDIDMSRGQIPLWVDINGGLQVEWWEKALAAVLGLLSLRPGAGTGAVARMLDWVLTPWEADLVLQWSRSSGLARHTQSGKGWNTTAWWWMALNADIQWR